VGANYDLLLWTKGLSWKGVCLSSYKADIRMALMELRMLLAALVMRYSWTGIPDKPGQWDEEMRPYDTTIIHPWKGKCMLKLEPTF
jgi:hypothetical protein